MRFRFKARRALDRKTFEKSFIKIIAPNGRGLLGLCPKNPLLPLRRQALRGRARRVKDQSLTIQQTFARQKFDQKRRAHARAQKPSTHGAEVSAINSLLTK